MLAKQLRSIEGRFIFSINDVPQIRAYFSWAKIDAVELNYSITKGEGKKASELIITNIKKRLSAHRGPVQNKKE